MDLRRAKLLLIPAVLASAARAAPAANAGGRGSSAQSCASEQFSQPFAHWLDYANYTPVPGGSFEPGQTPWTLSGGAKVVAGNEGFKVRSAADGYSLSLPQGATATSPAICVGLQEPTLRYFAKQAGSLLGITGSMTAEVLFEDSLGNVQSLPIGAGALGTAWSPSLPDVITASLLPLLPDQKTAVAFRFHAVTGSWQVDDVYVDPYCK